MPVRHILCTELAQIGIGWFVRMRGTISGHAHYFPSWSQPSLRRLGGGIFLFVCLHLRFTPDNKCVTSIAILRIVSFTRKFVDRGVYLIFLRLV